MGQVESVRLVRNNTERLVGEFKESDSSKNLHVSG